MAMRSKKDRPGTLELFSNRALDGWRVPILSASCPPAFAFRARVGQAALDAQAPICSVAGCRDEIRICMLLTLPGGKGGWGKRASIIFLENVQLSELPIQSTPTAFASSLSAVIRGYTCIKFLFLLLH
jgi:hypothetical protein